MSFILGRKEVLLHWVSKRQDFLKQFMRTTDEKLINSYEEDIGRSIYHDKNSGKRNLCKVKVKLLLNILPVELGFTALII